MKIDDERRTATPLAARSSRVASGRTHVAGERTNLCSSGFARAVIRAADMVHDRLGLPALVAP